MEEEDTASHAGSLGNIFLLTEVTSESNPRDYMDETTIPQAYNSALYNIRLSSRIRDHIVCRRLLENHTETISALIDPLFTDVHGLFFNAAIRKDSPPTSQLRDLWNTCYGEIYVAVKNKKYVDSFLDALPYVLTYSIIMIYTSLPTPLGLAPPSRIDISRRIVFLFTSIQMLDSQLESEMTKYFGEEEELQAAARRPSSPPVLIPVEDISDLVDLERRPRNRPLRFDMNSRSPISKVKSKLRVDLKFMYPKHGEKTFREDLKPFTQKPKRPDDLTPDLDTKSLLMRARCRNAEYNLRQAQMTAAVKRTGLVHRFQQDQEMIEMKRDAVATAPEKDQVEFMRQLARNHEKGNYMDDPLITLELLRKRPKSSLIQPAVTQAKKGSIEQIVDSVLSQCAVEQRRRDEVEIHCSHEFRNTVIDVRRLFDKKPEKMSTTMF